MWKWRQLFDWGFYDIVVSEFGFLSIEVIKMQKQDFVQNPRYADMKTSTKFFD